MKKWYVNFAHVALMIITGECAWSSDIDRKMRRFSGNNDEITACKAQLDEKYTVEQQHRILDNLILYNRHFWPTLGDIIENANVFKDVHPDVVSGIIWNKTYRIEEIEEWIRGYRGSKDKDFLSPCPNLGRNLKILWSLHNPNSNAEVCLPRYWRHIAGLNERTLRENAAELFNSMNDGNYNRQYALLSKLAERDQIMLLDVGLINTFHSIASNNRSQAQDLFNQVRSGLYNLCMSGRKFVWNISVNENPIDNLRRIGQFDAELWDEILPLISDGCDIAHILRMLDLLENPANLAHLTKAKELGLHTKWDFGAYVSVVYWLSTLEQPLADADYEFLKESFAGRTEDTQSLLTTEGIRKLSNKDDRKRARSAIIALRDHGNALSATLAFYAFEYLCWYPPELQNLLVKNLAQNPEGVYSDRDSDLMDKIKKYFSRLAEEYEFNKMLAASPLGIHPQSWHPAAHKMNINMLPAENRPVVVFDIDECILTCSYPLNSYQNALEAMTENEKNYRNSVIWTKQYGPHSIVQHRFMALFPEVLENIVNAGWRVAYFSSGPEERNHKLIDDSHIFMFGPEIYTSLKSKGQFAVFSKGNTTVVNGREGKDLQVVLMDGEKLENAVMWEDKTSNCHNEGQVFRLDLQLNDLLDSRLSDTEYEFWPATCLIGLHELIKENPATIAFSEHLLAIINQTKSEKGDWKFLRHFYEKGSIWLAKKNDIQEYAKPPCGDELD